MENMETQKRFAYLRIAFGLVWAVDAWLKWQPTFQANFASNFTMAQGMPAILVAWTHLFSSIININPPLFATGIALAETAIALGLIFGFLTRVAIVGGLILSFSIWTTVEGLGMFWLPGSIELGPSIVYILVFIALWLSQSWQTLSLDSFLKKKTS